MPKQVAAATVNGTTVYREIEMPGPGPTLHIAPLTQINYDSRTRMPNRWWRFWQWVLLGWRWEPPKRTQ